MLCAPALLGCLALPLSYLLHRLRHILDLGLELMGPLGEVRRSKHAFGADRVAWHGGDSKEELLRFPEHLLWTVVALIWEGKGRGRGRGGEGRGGEGKGKGEWKRGWEEL